MVYETYNLYCTKCGKQYKEASDESAEEVRQFAKKDGWVYKKVENGSYWDFCPKCAAKENISTLPVYVFMKDGDNKTALKREDDNLDFDITNDL